MSQSINVGIAGFGMSARVFHAPFLHVDSRYRIKKIYERNQEKSKEIYPYVEVVHDYKELLTEDIDLIIICTPNDQHYLMAKMAIEKKKNVIVEKPMTVTSLQAYELCELAKALNVMFSVYQNRRFDGDFLTVKKLINEGALGDIVDYEVRFNRFVVGKSSKVWKANGGLGINVLYDLGVHLIDQAIDLFGFPKSIYATLRKERDVSSSIDYFLVILNYNSLQVKLYSSETAIGRFPNFAVWGKTGSFIKFGTDVQEQNSINGMKPDDNNFGSDIVENYGTLTQYINNETIVTTYRTEKGNYQEFYNNIYNVLTSNAELIVKPLQCARVISILELAEKSSNEKREIIVD
jgi:predicted dehydrogenase